MSYIGRLSAEIGFDREYAPAKPAGKDEEYAPARPAGKGEESVPAKSAGKAEEPVPVGLSETTGLVNRSLI